MKAEPEQLLAGRARTFECRPRNQSRFPFHWHFHPEFELTLIQGSSGQRFVGNSIAPYQPGDLVLLGSNLPHTWASRPHRTTRARAMVVHVARDFFSRDWLELKEMTDISSLLARSTRGLLFRPAVAARAEPLLERLQTETGFKRLHRLLEILDLISPLKISSPLSSPDYSHEREIVEKRVPTLFKHIHEQAANPIRQATLAQMMHMSPSTLYRFFKRATGKTLPGYINEIRVGMVCNLLLETDQSIESVASQCGFTNWSNFNRRFRAIKGCTPGQFRASFRH